MKFSAACILALFSLPANCSGQQLKDKWAIGYGITTYDEDKSSGKYVFTSDFTFSDYVRKGEIGVSYRLYDGPSCGDGKGESTVQNSGAGYLESAIDISILDDKLYITIKSTVDPTKLPGSPIFDGSTVGKAVVAWCLRVMASTTGSIAKEVNFNELVYTVDVDLTAGFNVTNLSVKKRDADQASQNVSYDVDACECDGSDCVTQNERREQGSIVTVCVKPKPRATAAGVYMRSIKEFAWKRDEISQPAIAENKEADNLLTSYSDCQGASMCVFTSILFADFYKTEGVVNGSGEAILQFGVGADRRGRKLRSLQEDAEVASIADFDLNFAVNPTLGGANSSGSPAGSMLFTALLAAAGTWMMM